MKKFLLLILMLFLVSGCAGGKKMAAGYSDMMDAIPDNEFTKFSYVRSGMYSSATITATGAAKEGDLLMIESLNIQLNYGPENLTINLEGYIRDGKLKDKFKELAK